MCVHVRAQLTTLLLAALALGGCDTEEIDNGFDSTRADLSFLPSVQVGDIILTSKNPERGCDYLNWFQNFLSNLRYCHAELVIDVKEYAGDTSITTIEAASIRTDVVIRKQRQRSLSRYTDTKLAVLRVVDENEQPLSAQLLSEAVAKSQEWIDVDYIVPPIDIDGDPKEVGTYCSLLIYRAFLDTTGIDLDGWLAFVISPDELYESAHTQVIFESAPQDPPDDDTEEEEDECWDEQLGDWSCPT